MKIVKLDEVKMYYVATGKRIKRKFEYFIDAFKHQQDKHPNKKIIYSDGKIIEVVWKPEWENIRCETLDKKESQGF
ncbi:MAG: hypothetical protein ACOCRK_01020 [bacterium]